VLALFDIDGTLLLRASAAHRDAVVEALGEVYGIGDADGPAGFDAAGATDLQIARAICTSAGIGPEQFAAGAAAFVERSVVAYERRCPADLSAHVAPGVPAVLEVLAGRPGTRLSLVTGNLEAVAHRKLRAAGIGGYFEPGQGGFGSDHEDRTLLPALARERAGGWARADTVIIGDTPRDIACARADGVRCIAVATGPHPAEALREADVVIDDATQLLDAL
jgi:phosphoglycolate phosphatase